MNKKEFVRVPIEVLNKMTLICDVSEFSNNASVAKMAKEVRAEINKGFDYI